MQDYLSETVTKDTTSKGRLLERDRHTYKRTPEKKGRRRKRATTKEDTQSTGRKKYKTKQENKKRGNQGEKTSQF